LPKEKVVLPNGRLTKNHDRARSKDSMDEIREAERGGGCSGSGGNGKYEYIEIYVSNDVYNI